MPNTINPWWHNSIPTDVTSHTLGEVAQHYAVYAETFASGKSLKKKVKVEEEEDMSKPSTPKEGFTFGCDPEGFVFKDGKPIPAKEAGVPGTKEEPCNLFGGVSVHVDGMAAEFNIPPVDNFEDWDGYIATAIDQLTSLLPEGCELKFIPSVSFDPDVFEKADDYSKMLGCQPDIDAWSGSVNPVPNPENPYLRCAGGHLHIGWTENESSGDLQHVLNCQDLVKQLDWYLGGWSALEDTDSKRRSLYGKMGACRYKPYGVEYRVLSPFWVNTKALRLAVWNRMNTAINLMASFYIPDKLPRNFEKFLRNAINDSAPGADLVHVCNYPLKTLAFNQRHF